jgi:hypothetical protein
MSSGVNSCAIEHATGGQDGESDHGAERELAYALSILEERGADGVGNPDGLAAVGRFLGDAPGDLELVRRERGLVPATRDLEVELSVLVHAHEEAAVGARDLNDGVDDADQELVPVERACDLSARPEDVIDTLEIGGRARARRRTRLREKLPLPLREPPAQALQRIHLGQFRRTWIVLVHWIRAL